MAQGRIHAVAVTTRIGSVIYERFYDSTTEEKRAEIRASFQDTRTAIGRKAEEGKSYVGTYKCKKRHHGHPTHPLFRRGAAIVFTPVGDVVFFALGSGDYDELACVMDA